MNRLGMKLAIGLLMAAGWPSLAQAQSTATPDSASAAAPVGSVQSGKDGAGLAARFGALESVQHISLSPSGDQVAFISPIAGGAKLSIANIAQGGVPKGVLVQRNPGETLHGCSWATETRLVCTVSVIKSDGDGLIGFSRLFAVDPDGANIKLLTDDGNTRSLYNTYYGGRVIDWDIPDKPGKVLMQRDYVPEESIGTNIRRDVTGLGVEEVDVSSLQRRMVERGRPDATVYLTDGHGNVPVMGLQPRDIDGYARSRRSYHYRKQGSREWEALSKVVIGEAAVESGFEPYAVDARRNVVFGFDDHNGYQALFSITLDASATRNLELSHPDVDIDSLVRIGRDRRVVGASFATERRQVDFFDPELKKLAQALGKVLPGQPQISFVDAGVGEQMLLLLASSDVDPGTFYRFDKRARKLEPLLQVRERLAGLTMAEMKPVTFPSTDGTMIPGYLTLPPGSAGKNLPAIVMPHGGPGSRDEWGFDWLVQFFAARGYAVLQPNFRGSTGYGSAWYQKNGFQSWRTAVGDVNDAGRWLIQQGITTPDRLAVVGWSYGGYAALQSSVLDPGLFKAVVGIAPVTDLDRLRAEAKDYVNFPIVDKFIGYGPHVREGSPAQHADRFHAPVLLFHGDRDQNVGIGQSRLMADRLRGAGKSVQLIEFPGLAHSLSDGAARTRMLAESDAFLRRSLNLPAD